MLSKTAFIRALLFTTLFTLIKSVYALTPYDRESPYLSFDNVQLDSVIRVASARYQSYPASPALLKELAEAFTAKREIDSATIYWLKLAEIQPQNDTAWYRQALLMYDAGKLESSFASLQQSLNISPDKTDYLALYAATAYRLHMEDTALAFSQRILERDPQNINALLLSGIILRNQKHYDDALIQFEHCLQADPANTDALIHRAEIYVLLRKYNDALRDYSAARADLSSNADIINNLGICYYESGSYQRAINFFQKAIFINSLHPQSNFNKGIAYYNLKNFDSASVDIKAASQIWDTSKADSAHANFLDGIYYLGMCYKNTGDLVAAKKNFELLQKENYPQDLSTEIKHIEYALFISQNWYYIVLVFLLLIALIIAVLKAMRRK